MSAWENAGESNEWYGFAYRVLDAQFFGVAQRRRRVFVVGYAGDWRRAAAVLFERHSLSGHPAPRREAGPSVAALTANGVGTYGADDNLGQAGHLIPSTGDTSHCLNAGDPCHPLARGAHPPAVAFALRGRDGGVMPEIEGNGDRIGALRAASGGSSRDYVAFADCFNGQVSDTAPTMGTRGSSVNSSGPTLLQASAVRRLTLVREGLAINEPNYRPSYADEQAEARRERRGVWQ